MSAVYKTLSKSSNPADASSAPKRTKQRVLILSSRGVTYRHRHLLNDLYSLLPHSRKDAKLDTKTKLYQLNELAELYNCNNILFFEARKGKDLYVWISKAPNGPTVKMHMQNCRDHPQKFYIRVWINAVSQYIQCQSFTFPATVSKAHALFSHSTQRSTRSPTRLSSKSYLLIHSRCLKEQERRSPSLIM